MTAKTLSVAFALWGPAAGCSFIFTAAPTERDRSPNRPLEQRVSCSTHYAPPLLDVLLTGVQVVSTVIAVRRSDADYRGAPISRDADVGIGVAVTGLALSSAIYGFRAVGECRDLDASVAQ
jgi:hypothetical protein